MHRVLIVDGSQALFKTLLIGKYTPILTQANVDIGAVPYFFMNLKYAIQNLNPSQAIIVWDGGPNSWSKRRLEICPTYKMTRREKTDEQKEKVELFRQQKPIITLLFPHFGLSNLELPEREADDVIAQLCYNLPKNWEAIIYSDDRDFRQLVSETVSLFCPMSKLLYGTKGLQPDTLSPKAYLLYKACLGDPSDNIYGVPDVGKVTLDKVFETFQGESPADLYMHLWGLVSSGQGGNRIRKLFDGFDTILLNLQLMDLSREVFHADEIGKIQQAFVQIPPVTNDQTIYTIFDKFRLTGLTRDFENFMGPFRVMHQVCAQRCSLENQSV